MIILTFHSPVKNREKDLMITLIMVVLLRSLDFTVSLLQKSKEEPRLSMEQAVEDAYNLTLKPWHGWISSAAFKVIILFK